MAGTLSGFRSPPQTPRGMVAGAAAAWREVLYFLDQFKGAAAAAYCVLGSAALLLRICEAQLCALCVALLMPRGCPGSSRWRALGLLRLCLRVRRPRTTHQDKQSCPCKTNCFFPCWSRHTCHDTVVAPILSAPLLTDTRWSTVGSGTLRTTR